MLFEEVFKVGRMSGINSVTTGAADENHRYAWKIRNFAMVQKNEKLVTQQKFEIDTGITSACHSLWTVGMKICDETHIGFYCTLVNVLAESGFGKKNEEVEVPMGLTVNVKYNDGNTINKTLQKTLKIGESCGFEKVWTFNWPNWDRYLPSDASLTVNLVLTIYIPVTASRKTDIALAKFQGESKAKLQEDLAAILKNVGDSNETEEDCSNSKADLKIVSSDGKEFPCHKLILGVRSPYFETLFRSGFSECTTGIIKMDDISAKTVNVLLHYIYTGQLLDEWLEPDVIVDFTYAVGKYQFTEVLELLDSLLGSVQEQTSANSVVLLDLANKLSLKTAEAELMKRIVRFTVTADKSEELLSVIGNQE